MGGGNVCLIVPLKLVCGVVGVSIKMSHGPWGAISADDIVTAGTLSDVHVVRSTLLPCGLINTLKHTYMYIYTHTNRVQELYNVER